MMKKIFLFVGLACLLTLSACGNQKTNATSQTNTHKTTTSKKSNTSTTQKTAPTKSNSQMKSKYPYPSNADVKGKGQVVVSTASGDSKSGNVPVMFVSGDTLITQIGIDLSNFDGSKLTYIYVNKQFVQTEQVGTEVQTEIDLKGNLLKPGTYNVTAVQFKNGDPKSGEVTELAKAKYQIKSK